MSRQPTKLIHYKGKNVHKVEKDGSTGLLYIAGTDNVVPSNRVSNLSKSGYDFSKPMQAQDLGDEWEDYAWGADDF